jgi:DNA-directed RNA polymerase subunit alpha
VRRSRRSGFDGVLHEFSTVPGNKADVAEIILNTRTSWFSSEQDEPVVMYLRKQGPGVVTAGDITPPPASRTTTPISTSPRSTRRASSRSR